MHDLGVFPSFTHDHRWECVLRERRSNRLALGLWLLLASAVLYAFPYLFDFLLDLVSEAPVPLLQHDIGTLWLARGYFVLFMIGNAILFYAFRSAGVRLRAGYPGKVPSQERVNNERIRNVKRNGYCVVITRAD